MWKLLGRKLDQTNFPFYPTEDKVSPPLPSISPLDMWKKLKPKKLSFQTDFENQTVGDFLLSFSAWKGHWSRGACNTINQFTSKSSETQPEWKDVIRGRNQKLKCPFCNLKNSQKIAQLYRSQKNFTRFLWKGSSWKLSEMTKSFGENLSDSCLNAARPSHSIPCLQTAAFVLWPICFYPQFAYNRLSFI